MADAAHVFAEKNMGKDKREITGELGFKKYDSWGFNGDITMLAEIMNMGFDESKFQEAFDE